MKRKKAIGRRIRITQAVVKGYRRCDGEWDGDTEPVLEPGEEYDLTEKDGNRWVTKDGKLERVFEHEFEELRQGGSV